MSPFQFQFWQHDQNVKKKMSCNKTKMENKTKLKKKR
jgi:hypothetical protein